jgi:hypothetical protein
LEKFLLFFLKEIPINPLSGKYTGHTNVKLLKPEELEGAFIPWTRKVRKFLLDLSNLTELFYFRVRS